MAGSPTSNPRVNIQLLPAALVDAFEDRRCIIFGQTGPGGAAVSEALNIDMHLATDAVLQTLFGTADLYQKILAWRSGAQVSDGGILPTLDVIAIDESGTGVAADSTVQFTGTATADGTYIVSFVDEKKFPVTVAVSSGDANTVIAAALDAALTALTDPPFTNAVVTDTVTVTAKDKGTIGNDFGVRVTGVVAGVTVAVTAFTSGANDPVLTSILDAIDGRRYTGVGWPESWVRTVIVTEMDSRFNVANDILDGMIFQGSTDTFANNTSLVAPLNSQSLVIMGNNINAATLDKGPAILIPADWVASFFMAIRAKRLTTGALIADLIVAQNAPNDAIGGPGLASMPYFNTPLTDTPVTSSLNLYNSTEQIELENDGFTSFGVNTVGNAMLMGPVVTTFITDSAGNPNDSFHFLNFVDTGSVCREIFFRTLKAVFSQHRLTEGNIVEGRAMTNELGIKGELLNIYRVLADQALTQAGPDAEAFFNANTTVTVSLATRTVTINGPLPIVTQLGTINYNLSLAFTVGQTGTQITL